jgi:hypothetical protein
MKARKLIKYLLITIVALSSLSFIFHWAESTEHRAYVWGTEDTNGNFTISLKNLSIENSLPIVSSVFSILLPIYTIAIYARGKLTLLQASLVPVFSIIAFVPFFIHNKFILRYELSQESFLPILTIMASILLYVIVDAITED